MNEQPENTPTPNKVRQLVKTLSQVMRNVWLRFTQTKFYQNKKIFLPVSVSFGLIFLIILIGLIFGGKKSVKVVKNTPSPVPIFTEKPNTGNAGNDTLSQIEQQLTDIKGQINNLDVKQSRLQPPTLNFNIKF